MSSSTSIDPIAAFWSEAETALTVSNDLAGQIPPIEGIRPSHATITSLIAYWRANEDLLRSELVTNAGDLLSLYRESKSGNAKISIIATTLLKLQKCVIKQLDDQVVASQGEQKSNLTTCSIAPWMIDGGVTSSEGGGTSSPLVEHRLSSTTNGLNLRGRSVSITTLGSNGPTTDDQALELDEENIIELNSGLSVKRRLRANSSPNTMDSDILEKLFEHLRMRILKAKWTNDLHEFIADYSLSPNSFEFIRLRLDFAFAKVENNAMKFLSCSSQRPCWAVTGDAVKDVFGEKNALKFTNLTGSGEADGPLVPILLHTIYVLYDFARELFSVKVICSPQDDIPLTQACFYNTSDFDS